MENYIYYNPVQKGILIKSNFEELKKRMDIGLSPKINYEIVNLNSLKSKAINYISFDNINDYSFSILKSLFTNYSFESIGFHQTQLDLSQCVIKANHLIVGDKSIIEISSAVFYNLKEITFLSPKTFKGEIKNKLENVEKLIFWYGGNNTNDILSHFPNLKYLEVISANVTELNLSDMHQLETLQLHLCKKLEQVRVPDNIQFKTVIIEKCNKLDISNLGENVRVWGKI